MEGGLCRVDSAGWTRRSRRTVLRPHSYMKKSLFQGLQRTTERHSNAAKFKAEGAMAGSTPDKGHLSVVVTPLREGKDGGGKSGAVH